MTREKSSEPTTSYWRQPKNYNVYFQRGAAIKKDPYVQKTKHRPDHSIGLFKCLCVFTALAVVGIGGFLIWDKVVGNDFTNPIGRIRVNDFSRVQESLSRSDWRKGLNEDPYDGDNITYVWKTRDGDGLNLMFLNALDESWQTEFLEAVTDWAESDMFTNMTIEDTSVDYKCSPVAGVMKICNGNYGATGWLGINKVTLEYYRGFEYIVSSVAKMNEYYLHNAEYEQRQFIMCHEIGHGLGLSHSSSSNGNGWGGCMGYTDAVEDNMHPSNADMERLKNMYNYGSGVYYADDEYYNDYYEYPEEEGYDWGNYDEDRNAAYYQYVQNRNNGNDYQYGENQVNYYNYYNGGAEGDVGDGSYEYDSQRNGNVYNYNYDNGYVYAEEQEEDENEDYNANRNYYSNNQYDYDYAANDNNKDYSYYSGNGNGNGRRQLRDRPRRRVVVRHYLA